MLAINSGSSSLKFGLFTLGAAPAGMCRGTVADATDSTAVARLFQQIEDDIRTSPLAGVGHRIVHGGPALSTPRLVTNELLDTLRGLVPFAPNHLPEEIRLIERIGDARPGVPQFLCFDTAFHAGLPDVARRLPIPQAYDAQGVRRYGFHGLSYTYLLRELERRAGAAEAAGRIVLMHLGSGSSAAAVHQGRSVDTSMGFTPIGGVVMSSRSGDLDPGVVTCIARTSGFDPDRVEHELSHRSGLAGISGGVSDMRELLARSASDDGCRLAVAIYCYEIRKRLGAYAAALGGLDAIVFTGGIGERAAAVRAGICDGLGFLGVDLDDDANLRDAAIVSDPRVTRDRARDPHRRRSDDRGGRVRAASPHHHDHRIRPLSRTSTRTGAPRTTCRSARSICSTTRCCASRCGRRTSSRGCSGTGARRPGRTSSTRTSTARSGSTTST